MCPPSLVGAYFLHSTEARAKFLHNDLPCNDTCSKIGGSITYWGGHKRKRSEKKYSLISYENNERMNFFSMQAKSEIPFDLDSTCHVELWIWVLFHLDNFLTFWKKAIYEKSKFAYFVWKQRETNFFSTQARSEILFELETTCHVELWIWVSFHLDNFLTFRKKSYIWKK